jgi:hypothetical protein
MADASEAAKQLHDKVAQNEREILKLRQEINKYQAVPKSSTGETHNLGNADTPIPIEPTINEPGHVVFQTHVELDREGVSKVVHTPPEGQKAPTA